MSSQTFKVVGITVHPGSDAKVRFTDDLVRRVKQFTKGGAIRTDFIDLPGEMTKVEALNYMLTHPNYQSAEDQATINDALLDRAKPEKTAKPTKAKVSIVSMSKTPSLESIKARGKSQKAATPKTTVEDVLAAAEVV
jgi:hypothetical protein